MVTARLLPSKTWHPYSLLHSHLLVRIYVMEWTTEKPYRTPAGATHFILLQSVLTDNRAGPGVLLSGYWGLFARW
jgi:hypothetical protein